jgi:hypothetical protein
VKQKRKEKKKKKKKKKMPTGLFKTQKREEYQSIRPAPPRAVLLDSSAIHTAHPENLTNLSNLPDIKPLDKLSLMDRSFKYRIPLVFGARNQPIMMHSHGRSSGRK